MNQITFAVTGKTGAVDGYAELILGSLLISGVLLEQPILSKKSGETETTIYIEAKVRAMPLGHLGDADIPEREG